MGFEGRKKRIVQEATKNNYPKISGGTINKVKPINKRKLQQWGDLPFLQA